MMLAEPEAAAVYTARYLKEEEPDKTVLKVRWSSLIYGF